MLRSFIQTFTKSLWMLKILLEGLISTVHVFQGLKLQLIYYPTLPEVPKVMIFSTLTVIASCLPKKNHLLYILVVMSLEHFIAEYVSLKQPIKFKVTMCLSFLVAGKCIDEKISLPESISMLIF